MYSEEYKGSKNERTNEEEIVLLPMNVAGLAVPMNLPNKKGGNM